MHVQCLASMCRQKAVHDLMLAREPAFEQRAARGEGDAAFAVVRLGVLSVTSCLCVANQ